MKAISLWQPWATALVLGEKRVETRSWATNYTGPLLIHAAKTKRGVRSLLSEPADNALVRRGYLYADHFPLGGFVGMRVLKRVVRVEDVRHKLPAQELAFGDYSDGRFAWIMADSPVHRWQPIVPERGQQGLWDVDDEAIELARREIGSLTLTTSPPSSLFEEAEP